MALIPLEIRTEFKSIKELAEVPLLGHVFLFVLTFLQAVLLSFAAQSILPVLNNEIGFTKAMLVLLPGCNVVLWFMKIKL